MVTILVTLSSFLFYNKLAQINNVVIGEIEETITIYMAVWLNMDVLWGVTFILHKIYFHI